MKKTRADRADVSVTNCTFNAPTHGVKLDESTASAIRALAEAADSNAHAISAIANLIKGGDSYGLSIGKQEKES